MPQDFTDKTKGPRADTVTPLPVNTKPLSEQVYNILRQRILIGDLVPGSLLNIDVVADEFGTSGTPVRDAVHRLALEGLVKVRRRLGTVVTGFGEEEVREANQLRLFLEPSISEHVARKASDQLIADLRGNLAEWRKLDLRSIYADLDTYLRYAELNKEFHTRIASETGNRRLIATLDHLYIHPGVGVRVMGTDYQGPAARMEEHGIIIDTLEQRDPAQARAAMQKHLLAGRHDLLTFLEKG